VVKLKSVAVGLLPEKTSTPSELYHFIFVPGTPRCALLIEVPTQYWRTASVKLGAGAAGDATIDTVNASGVVMLSQPFRSLVTLKVVEPAIDVFTIGLNLNPIFSVPGTMGFGYQRYLYVLSMAENENAPAYPWHNCMVVVATGAPRGNFLMSVEGTAVGLS
jgi:hypothetical protein